MKKMDRQKIASLSLICLFQFTIILVHSTSAELCYSLMAETQSLLLLQFSNIAYYRHILVVYPFIVIAHKKSYQPLQLFGKNIYFCLVIIKAGSTKNMLNKCSGYPGRGFKGLINQDEINLCISQTVRMFYQ